MSTYYQDRSTWGIMVLLLLLNTSNISIYNTTISENDGRFGVICLVKTYANITDGNFSNNTGSYLVTNSNVRFYRSYLFRKLCTKGKYDDSKKPTDRRHPYKHSEHSRLLWDSHFPRKLLGKIWWWLSMLLEVNYRYMET